MKFGFTRCCLWTVGVVAIAGLPASASAQQFGMAGLGPGQTLRLNVVAFPPNPCRAAIGFLDSNGQTPQPQPGRTVALNPGQADHVDLSAASLGIQLGQRREFQPVVMIAVGDSVSQCAASVEVFETATGFTQVATPQLQPGNVNVSPQFGMIGITLGQVLRLNVVAFPPNPCLATIGFLDSTGQTPQPDPGKTVNLNPGQADHVDLSVALPAVQSGQRREFQPVVTLLPGPNGSSACQATAEVYDALTGRGWALLLPQL
jgi:hypothetical protein